MNDGTTNPMILSVGDFLTLDGGCPGGTLLGKDDGFKDSGFPGCEFRTDKDLAVNLVVTGRIVRWNSKGGFFGVRVKVEFVGDCEPSTFVGGWVKRSRVDQWFDFSTF